MNRVSKKETDTIGEIHRVKFRILFDDLIREFNRLLIYPGWLPIERRQLSFYSENLYQAKLMFFSKEFQSYKITNADYVSELTQITLPLNVLVSDILEFMHKGREFEVNLNRVGDRLAFDVALIFETFFAKEVFPDFRYFSHQSCISLDQANFKIYILFQRLKGALNMLLTHPDWLPIETCQITFYSEKLKFFSKEFRTLSITVPDLTLAIDVFDDLDSMSVDVESLNYNDPPDLTRVGDLLASTMALVYKTFFGKAKECDFPNFASQFYFDKNKFLEGEVFVGFQLEATNLLQQLASITKKQLQVISIVGMAGLGKTTLARRLYNDPYVVSYFHVRAWVTCSQLYQKRDLLLTILRSVLEITDQVCSMNDNTLAHHLYRALKGRRYLIVIDDIWSSQAWDDFKTSFPDDNNGSKIMLTTRLKDVALHAQPQGNPLSLRFLTEDESFDLLRIKACLTRNFLADLCSIGKSITRKCRGLPLAIVVIAGLLKNNFAEDWWAQVAESVSSYIVTDENQYMDTLALSYNHLPQHLRPCFLYFGAFPEDHDIPVRKLIRLWIAEGFICQDGTKKSLEDVAEDYLMDLMRRSLVVVGNKGFDGAIKTCRVHDLLHDLCLRKAKEENFSPKTYMCIKHSYCCAHSSVSDASLANPHANTQLFLSTNVLNFPSRCSCASSEVSQTIFKDIAMIWNTSKLITSLDISSIELFAFPSELLQLVNLRYLQLRFRHGDLPESISHLIELQTLVVSSRMNMVVPENLWKMINLKHLCIKSGENRVNLTNLEEPYLLENLQTMSLVSPTRPCQHILAKTPNLQKLGLCGPLTTKSGDFKCPDLGLLMHLKTLKLLNTTSLCNPVVVSTSIIFPEGLKKITVSNTTLDWTEAWIFEMIPNLEVLKLKFHAFVVKEWETSPEAFPRLKFLKLDELDIVTWTASRYDFPVLQRLQVYRCPYLMEIPEDFGNICTLEWIELSGCSDAATNSARDIQKEQESNGNDWLKFLLNPGLTPS